jgi:arylsulfatase
MMGGVTMQRREFLRMTAGAAFLPQQARRPPNIVLIYADDLGYGDLGCYGSRIRTPNLDRLAAEGARFTHYYSANPVCSPSRASLLTGRYPTRVGVPRVLFPKDTTGLPAHEKTLAELLKTRGYRTMCVGKWHLGHLPAFLPTSRGFDNYFGIPYSNDMNPCLLLRDTTIVEQQATLETLTPRYTEEAVRFLDRAKDSPFFLYFPHTYPHIPLAASSRFRGRSPLGLYGDVIEELDWSVGEVLGTLRHHSLDDNTLVLFSSDNGPWYQGSPGRLRGRKGSTWEGGVRVPLLARWTGRIPAGRTVDAIASALDIVPTITRLASASVPDHPVDGLDIWPLLSGATGALERDALLHFDDVHLQCARWRHWKLHVARYNALPYTPAPPGGKVNLALRRPELYHLLEDPDESYDVASENPQVVQEILGRIERLMATFPDPIRQAYAETKARPTAASATGAVARPAP